MSCQESGNDGTGRVDVVEIEYQRVQTDDDRLRVVLVVGAVVLGHDPYVGVGFGDLLVVGGYPGVEVDHLRGVSVLQVVVLQNEEGVGACDDLVLDTDQVEDLCGCEVVAGDPIDLERNGAEVTECIDEVHRFAGAVDDPLEVCDIGCVDLSVEVRIREVVGTAVVLLGDCDKRGFVRLPVDIVLDDLDVVAIQPVVSVGIAEYLQIVPAFSQLVYGFGVPVIPTVGEGEGSAACYYDDGDSDHRDDSLVHNISWLNNPIEHRC